LRGLLGIGNVHSTTDIVGRRISGSLLLNIHRLRLSVIPLYTTLVGNSIMSGSSEVEILTRKPDEDNGKTYVEEDMAVDSPEEGNSLEEEDPEEDIHCMLGVVEEESGILAVVEER
jgi:hypothetical protein